MVYLRLAMQRPHQASAIVELATERFLLVRKNHSGSEIVLPERDDALVPNRDGKPRLQPMLAAQRCLLRIQRVRCGHITFVQQYCGLNAEALLQSVGVSYLAAHVLLSARDVECGVQLVTI
jgi:hypothetical protein